MLFKNCATSTPTQFYTKTCLCNHYHLSLDTKSSKSKNFILDDFDWSATGRITLPLSIFDSILECVGGLSPNKSLSISDSLEYRLFCVGGIDSGDIDFNWVLLTGFDWQGDSIVGVWGFMGDFIRLCVGSVEVFCVGDSEF